MLAVLADSLANPEPTPTSLTEDELTATLFKNSVIQVRAARLCENIEKADRSLMADHSGKEIVGWTPKQRADIAAHIQQNAAALQDEIKQ